jgi:hypothetical protein
VIARRLVRFASVASWVVLGAAPSALPAAVTARSEASAAPEILVACGDGPAFPLTALDGLQGAELARDGAARRLAQAATTGEAGYVPRGGWMRVLGAADRVVFATWLRPSRSADGPLLQLTAETEMAGSTDPDDWRIVSAGFCWPRVVPPRGSGTVPWTLEVPADPASTSVRLVPAVPVCADPPPAVMLSPGHVSLTVLAPTDGHACVGPPSPTLDVDLPEPLGPRELLDGAFDPPAPVQAAPLPAPIATPPVDPTSVRVTAAARPISIAASHAIADSLDTGPGLVEVAVVDELAISLRLVSERDLALAGPLQLCLVGPFPAPDDAGLIDRCWGDPDPGAVLAPDLERDAAGHPILRAGEPITLDATIARGEVRCDYPPGDWHLEVVLTPLVDGHGWTDVALPPVPIAVDALGMDPVRELIRPESRYCGMATHTAPEGSAAP